MREKLETVIWGDIFGVLGRSLTTVEATLELERRIQEHGARHTKGTGQVFWVDASAEAPPEPVRREMRAMLARQGKSFRCMVTVIEGTGFRAAALRAVMTGFQTFNRRPYPVHIAGDLRSGLAWVLPQMEGKATRIGALGEAISVFERAGRAG